MSTASSDGPVVNVNGHRVSLVPSTDLHGPDAGHTDWFIVRFDRFVDYTFKQELRQGNLEVYDRMGDNIYLCKYTLDDLTPIINNNAVSHLALYPESAVPTADIVNPTPDSSATSGEAGSGRIGATTESTKKPFVLALHPNPSQSLQQVLELVQSSFGAENLDHEVAGNAVRVNLDPAAIPEISRIDSIRTIAKVQKRVPFSVRQRVIMQFLKSKTSADYKGKGEIVYVADTGFDKGVTDDVHPAFTGRVLAAVSAVGSTNPADLNGHGTHVAGSVLGNHSRYPGTDMSNVQGTAPESKLVSIGIEFDKFPTTLSILTQDVPPYGPPTILSNSWGNSWEWCHQPYGVDDAYIVDQVMHENSHACILFAAGNDGQYVTLDDKQQQIGDFASAKNCITVGASYSDRPLDANDIGYDPIGKVHSVSEVADFSSTGPTVEGRVAPDVVTPGCIILSARSRGITPDSLKNYLETFGKPDYDDLLYIAGTSMATPAASGCVAVLRSAFRAQQGTVPTGSLLKALMVHGAVDLVGTRFKVDSFKASGEAKTAYYTMTPAPNPFQGYGRVEINDSLYPIIGPISGQRGYVDGALPTGPQNRIYPISIPSSARSLTVTLAYTDLPGECLQNLITLSVKLSDGSMLHPLKPTDPMGRTFDWQPSNVAKIVASNLRAGQADILLDILTGEPSASFAVVWTVA